MPGLFAQAIRIGNAGVARLVSVLAEHRRQHEPLPVALGGSVVLVIALGVFAGAGIAVINID